MNRTNNNFSIRKVRTLLIIFTTALIISGLTAYPIREEVKFLSAQVKHLQADNSLRSWIMEVDAALTETHNKYPFLLYGTDWLAFGHLCIAVFLIGAVFDPIRNKFIIDAAFLICLLVIPHAFVMGTLRHIPFFWQCVDCSFGVGGAALLHPVRMAIREKLNLSDHSHSRNHQ